MTIQTTTYRNIRQPLCNAYPDHPRRGVGTYEDSDFAILMAARVDTFSNTFRYRAEDGKVARLSPVSQKSLTDLTRKDA